MKTGRQGGANGREFDATAALSGLRPFQRRTVDHVIRRFHGPDGAPRFLVADETGLGKSLVAKGVIARTIEKLQKEAGRRRITVVYVCSNADLARQNLTRLDVVGAGRAVPTRLTLLATQNLHLDSESDYRVPTTLVSFTPGTSFSAGWRTGHATERALLVLLLKDVLSPLSRARDDKLLAVLQGTVRKRESFQVEVSRLAAEISGGLDPAIARRFRSALDRSPDMVGTLEDLMNLSTGQISERFDETSDLIGRLRSILARASIDALDPDLVILDEFQRFNDLLDKTTPAGELAHLLFEAPRAKVLLLSATPYKPFTYAEETDGGQHHDEFLRTIRFLSTDSSVADEVDQRLRNYREDLVSGRPTDNSGLRRTLLTIMCRTEREERAGLLVEERIVAAQPRPEDLAEFVRWRRVADRVGGGLHLDYWKSAPHFLHFMEKYQLGGRLRDKLKDGDDAILADLVAETGLLRKESLEAFDPVDLGNARLRNLAEQSCGLEKLLWIPPSLPSLGVSGVFTENGPVTKTLVFSSWSATPTAIAGMLSYEASRNVSDLSERVVSNTPEQRRHIASRFTFRTDNGRPTSMTTLALFWPMPGLAAFADPWGYARRFKGKVRADGFVRDLTARLASSVAGAANGTGTSAESWYWQRTLGRPDSLPSDVSDIDSLVKALSGHRDSDAGSGASALTEHVRLAIDVAADMPDPDQIPEDLSEVVARIAAFSPANIAWRSVQRILPTDSEIPDTESWRAAATLGAGLRALFSRWESIVLLDHLYPEENSYWRRVLRYCADGDLQAVLDEYLFHLCSSRDPIVTTADLNEVVGTAASALSLRLATYRGLDPTEPDQHLDFAARFALRYGASKDESGEVRDSEVREAFNSPFWPFVLASTSVGQEGIDFHWWCHRLVHWNVPANPADFEQREGRVNRFRGHAIRLNIAGDFRDRALSSAWGPGEHPWNVVYRLASDGLDRRNGLAPDWSYPGRSKVIRQLMPYPLSTDLARIERLKRDLASYRLTFGQPRQEDLLQILGERGTRAEPLDLRP